MTPFSGGVDGFNFCVCVQKETKLLGTAPWTNILLLLLITTSLTTLLSYFIKCLLVLRYQHVLES